MEDTEDRNHTAEAGGFAPFPQEKLLLTSRKHWFVLVFPITTILLLSIISMALVFVLFTFFPALSAYPGLFVTIILTILVTTISLITKIIVEWYLHLYIITTRRIFEACWSPLFNHWVNTILLDEVRCTELDIRKHGFINHLFNKGDIVITFDRPTHEEEFILADIYNPKQTGMMLEEAFESQDSTRPQVPIMYYPRQRVSRQLFGRRFGVGKVGA